MAVAFLAEVFILPATIKLLPRLFGAERAAARSTPRGTDRTLAMNWQLDALVWPGRRTCCWRSRRRPTGYVSVFVDHLPNRDATELRARGFAEEKLDAGLALSG